MKQFKERLPGIDYDSGSSGEVINDTHIAFQGYEPLLHSANVLVRKFQDTLTDIDLETMRRKTIEYYTEKDKENGVVLDGSGKLAISNG